MILNRKFTTIKIKWIKKTDRTVPFCGNRAKRNIREFKSFLQLLKLSNQKKIKIKMDPLDHKGNNDTKPKTSLF